METMMPDAAQDVSVVTRWIARFIALSLMFLTIMFVAASGVDLGAAADLPHRIRMAAFVVMFLGLLIGWKWETLGGSLTLAGLALFLVFDYLLFGAFLKFWIFLVFALPALLFLYTRYQEKHPS